tara:strand:- start:2881 stop:3432 length:552 start_codon:yes stop_codon:yes gene_type:complete
MAVELLSPRKLAVFNKSYEKQPPNNDGTEGCWLWKLQLDRDGYGKTVGVDGTESTRSNRMACYLKTGVWGKQALHSCDVANCVNPAHLRWGTHKENMEDKKNRNRTKMPKTIRPKPAKVTTDQVNEIRALHKETDPAKKLTVENIAKRFNISYTQTQRIISGKCWKPAIEAPPLNPEGDAPPL